MRAYLSCMKEQGDAHHLCRDQSKSYLSCRMERGLMAQEDLDTMGFGPGSQVVMGKHDSEQGTPQALSRPPKTSFEPHP